MKTKALMWTLIVFAGAIMEFILMKSELAFIQLVYTSPLFWAIAFIVGWGGLIALAGYNRIRQAMYK